MKRIFALILLFLSITACSGGDEDLKSPCVSLDDGPCGPRKAVNTWMS